jgi:hypothetical protein
VPAGRLTQRARACAHHLAAPAVALAGDEGVLRRYCQARRAPFRVACFVRYVFCASLGPWEHFC